MVQAVSKMHIGKKGFVRRYMELKPLQHGIKFA